MNLNFCIKSDISRDFGGYPMTGAEELKKCEFNTLLEKALTALPSHFKFEKTSFAFYLFFGCQNLGCIKISLDASQNKLKKTFE